jgi:hypothetical protein
MYINTSAFSVARGDLNIYILSISIDPFYAHSFLYRCPINDDSSKMLIDNNTTQSLEEKYLSNSGSGTPLPTLAFQLWYSLVVGQV